MEVKPGYKQTEVGVIPDSWVASKLQDACRETITYGIVQCGPHIRDGIPYVRVSDMDKPELDVDGMLRTSPTIAARFSRSTVQVGDLVYALRGKLGEVRQVGSAVAGANLTQGTARLSPKESVVSDYLKWAMRSSRVVRQAEIEAKGTTFREITLADLRRICVPVPPLPEQRAIAAALSDVDALLDGLDRLIAKKRNLKQAAMQQLLTGKTRLPGFHGEWKFTRLGKGISLFSGQHILAEHCNTEGDGTPYITGPADFPQGHIQHTKFTKRPGTICSPSDILVTVKGSGSGAIVLADAAYCISRQLMAIRVDGWDCRFIYYSLLQNAAKFKAASTGLIPGLSRSDILDQPLPIPPRVPEQTAIAAILSDMDAELSALEARREKTRDLKQAMMQELLTGKTRLVPAGAAHA